MPTGQDLIAAIVGNERLMDINNCPGVPTDMSKAFYSVLKGDEEAEKKGVIVKKGCKKKILKMIDFSGGATKTAVWHFMINGAMANTTRNPVHHFVVVPWYRPTLVEPERVYTVFMAYETEYTLGQYVEYKKSAPPRGKGYKEIWTRKEFGRMLFQLLGSPDGWVKYFGKVGKTQATKITYYKYEDISLLAAISNVNIFLTERQKDLIARQLKYKKKRERREEREREQLKKSTKKQWKKKPKKPKRLTRKQRLALEKKEKQTIK